METNGTLEGWLKSLSLEQYLSTFQNAGFTSLEHCTSLDDDLLNIIGITPLGHRKRILSHLPVINEGEYDLPKTPLGIQKDLNTESSPTCHLNTSENNGDVSDRPKPVPKPRKTKRIKNSSETESSDLSPRPVPAPRVTSSKNSDGSINLKGVTLDESSDDRNDEHFYQEIGQTEPENVTDSRLTFKPEPNDKNLLQQKLQQEFESFYKNTTTNVPESKDKVVNISDIVPPPRRPNTDTAALSNPAYCEEKQVMDDESLYESIWVGGTSKKTNPGKLEPISPAKETDIDADIEHNLSPPPELPAKQRSSTAKNRFIKETNIDDFVHGVQMRKKSPPPPVLPDKTSLKQTDLDSVWPGNGNIHTNETIDEDQLYANEPVKTRSTISNNQSRVTSNLIQFSPDTDNELFSFDRTSKGSLLSSDKTLQPDTIQEQEEPDSTKINPFLDQVGATETDNISDTKYGNFPVNTDQYFTNTGFEISDEDFAAMIRNPDTIQESSLDTLSADNSKDVRKSFDMPPPEFPPPPLPAESSADINLSSDNSFAAFDPLKTKPEVPVNLVSPVPVNTIPPVPPRTGSVSADTTYVNLDTSKPDIEPSISELANQDKTKSSHYSEKGASAKEGFKVSETSFNTSIDPFHGDDPFSEFTTECEQFNQGGMTTFEDDTSSYQDFDPFGLNRNDSSRSATSDTPSSLNLNDVPPPPHWNESINDPGSLYAMAKGMQLDNGSSDESSDLDSEDHLDSSPEVLTAGSDIVRNVISPRSRERSGYLYKQGGCHLLFILQKVDFSIIVNIKIRCHLLFILQKVDFSIINFDFSINVNINIRCHSLFILQNVDFSIIVNINISCHSLFILQSIDFSIIVNIEIRCHSLFILQNFDFSMNNVDFSIIVNINIRCHSLFILQNVHFSIINVDFSIIVNINIRCHSLFILQNVHFSIINVDFSIIVNINIRCHSLFILQNVDFSINNVDFSIIVNINISCHSLFILQKFDFSFNVNINIRCHSLFILQNFDFSFNVNIHIRCHSLFILQNFDFSFNVNINMRCHSLFILQNFDFGINVNINIRCHSLFILQNVDFSINNFDFSINNVDFSIIVNINIRCHSLFILQNFDFSFNVNINIRCHSLFILQNVDLSIIVNINIRCHSLFILQNFDFSFNVNINIRCHSLFILQNFDFSINVNIDIRCHLLFILQLKFLYKCFKCFIFSALKYHHILVKGNKGWRKRWVIFNGRDVRYYTNAKGSDTSRFKFQLVTKHRVFMFAAETLDDCTMWSSTLMEAILNYTPPPGGEREGGDMYDPDKQGYVKFERKKDKYYVAIKQGKLCYYNSEQDFKQASPIHEIEMKLASVKEVSKNKLQMSTHYAYFILVFDSYHDCLLWRMAIEEAIADGLGDNRVLNEVQKNTSNLVCADCDTKDPHWASINLGIVLCKKCAGIHRHFDMMKAIGNDNAKRFWEGTLRDKISESTPPAMRKQFLENKYKLKAFCNSHPLTGNQNALDEVLYSRSSDPEGETAFQIAKKSGQRLQMEFLYQNGGDKNSRGYADSEEALALRLRSEVCLEGFLMKTGSNMKDFLKRWCSSIAKDSIEHECIQCIHATPLDRTVSTVSNISRKISFRNPSPCEAWHLKIKYILNHIHCYTNDYLYFVYILCIYMIYYNDAVYRFLYTSENIKAYKKMSSYNKTCHFVPFFFFFNFFFENFIIFILDNFNYIIYQMNVYGTNYLFCPVPLFEEVGHLDFCLAGNFYVREGLTSEWRKTWLMINNKVVQYTDKDVKLTEQIDLRKVMNLKYQDAVSACTYCSESGRCFAVDIPGKERGIYREAAVNSKVQGILNKLTSDVYSLVLQREIHTVHEIANVLKRFLRNLKEPLLTSSLYDQWLQHSGNDHDTKLKWYKYLISQLPDIHRLTLKLLAGHLSRISKYSDENLMTIENIAIAFGSTLMKASETQLQQGNIPLEMKVIGDIVQYHEWLFDVPVENKDEEIERNIEEAKRKMEMLQRNTVKKSLANQGNLIISIYYLDYRGQSEIQQVTSTTDVRSTINLIKKRLGIKTGTWSLHEVVCKGLIERPLHPSDNIYDIAMAWAGWEDPYRSSVCLCLKPDDLIQKIDSAYEFGRPLFADLKYSEKKTFKKFTFEFKQSRLSYSKDMKSAGTPINCWNIEDLNIYIGTDPKRTCPTNKDTPFFGRTVCCNTEEELMCWVAAMMVAQIKSRCLFSHDTFGRLCAGFDCILVKQNRKKLTILHFHKCSQEKKN
ncbi:hypothetical protein KUTeg_023950 [Tegillarca granosa]|uniref:Arf-GAP with Rho-GAP domain, ANK repeat and PH domain-containing protein 1 n=1 Tax=Tegillarca granosa TaxID=220873 RepID=A0ABQ9E060_TEGGR|nr:hypothetical protein KUTeg_023950 [Tegillarca granosa]